MWCWRGTEKVGWNDRVRDEEVLHRVKEDRNILDKMKRRKANLIGHILCGNCLLKQVME
jgi:ppGpp synthetase/RelA/SpoT-type nucleotidyltranferase